jgi:hypothetical protein
VQRAAAAKKNLRLAKMGRELSRAMKAAVKRQETNYLLVKKEQKVIGRLEKMLMKKEKKSTIVDLQNKLKEVNRKLANKHANAEALMDCFSNNKAHSKTKLR